MKSTFSNKITIINFIMTCFICCYHFSIFAYGYTASFGEFKELMGWLAMAIFFFISGFLLFNNANTEEDMRLKIKKRFKSLLIPYFIWNIAFILKDALMVKNLPIPFSVNNVLNWFLFGPANGSLWYLFSIYLLSLFSVLIIKLKKHKKVTTLLFVLSLVYLYLKTIGIIPAVFIYDNWWWYSNTIAYLPYYIIGCYCAMYLKDRLLDRDFKNIVYIVSFILFFVFVCFKCCTPNVNKFYLGFWMDIVVILLFWLMIPNAIFKNKLTKITENSFFMYVMHVPFLIPLANRILKFMFPKVINSFWWLLFIYLFAIVLMFVICCMCVTLLKLICFKSNKVFLLFSGGRVKNDIAIKLEARRAKKLKDLETLDETKNDKDVNN